MACARPSSRLMRRMARHRLDQLVAHRVEWMQRRLRVLEDIGHVAAAQAAQDFVGRADKVFAPVVDGSPPVMTPGGEATSPHDAERRYRLARPALSDEAHAFAGLEAEVHAANGLVDAVLDVELGLEVPDGEQVAALWLRDRAGAADHRGGHGPARARRIFSRGSSASRTPSPSRLMAITITRIIRPGTMEVCGLVISAERASPSMEPRSARGGWLPRPRNDSPRRLEDHPAHGGGHGAMTMTGDDVGQDLGHDDLRVRHAGELGRVDEFLVHDAHGHPADVAGEEGDVDGGHRDQCVHQAGAECRDNGQRQQDVGKGHQHVDAAHDDVVRCAPP